MQLPSVPGLFRRLTLIRSVIKRQRKIVYQHFKDYKELLFAKSSKKCIRRRKFLNLVELFGFVIFEKKKKQLLRKRKGIFEKIKFDNIKIKSSFFIKKSYTSLSQCYNTSSIINFSIFLFHITKKIKDSNRKEISKKKTHENPKNTSQFRQLIFVLVAPFNSIALP